jgi:hypothetical protein
VHQNGRDEEACDWSVCDFAFNLAGASFLHYFICFCRATEAKLLLLVFFWDFSVGALVRVHLRKLQITNYKPQTNWC